MEMATKNQENTGPLARGRGWFKALPETIWGKVVEVARMTKKPGQDDPRRIIHSLKVGLALTLVSLFYYHRPLYDGFGANAMWAILTVVVVFEFSVGATLGKGINRMFATLLGAALGIAANKVTSFSGEFGEPMLLELFVFLLAAIATYARFFPRMKASYDYGLVIFILTFCLVSVTGYREDELLDIALQRLWTIITGSFTAIIVCIFICPVWIGEDLQKQVAGNMDKLGNFLEGFGGEYFEQSEDGQSMDNKSFLQGYEGVLNSKSSEETMANLAKWEPGHGQFGFRHPWKQYLKLGILTRQCAYKIEALNSYLNAEIQTPAAIRCKIKEPCTEISSESGKALKKLASTIKRMTRSYSADPHIARSKTVAENLKTLLKTCLWEGADILDIIPAAAITSLLIDVVTCIEKISEAAHELAALAHFKSVDPTVSPEQPQLLHRGTVQPLSDLDGPHHLITVGGSRPSFTENMSSCIGPYEGSRE